MATPQKEEPARLSIQGEEITLVDVESLELGEVEQIEDAFGLPIEEIDFRRTKAFRYLIFFSMKRADKDVSLDDLSSMKVTEFEEAKKNGAKRPTAGRAKG